MSDRIANIRPRQAIGAANNPQAGIMDAIEDNIHKSTGCFTYA